MNIISRLLEQQWDWERRWPRRMPIFVLANENSKFTIFSPSQSIYWFPLNDDIDIKRDNTEQKLYFSIQHVQRRHSLNKIATSKISFLTLLCKWRVALYSQIYIANPRQKQYISSYSNYHKHCTKSILYSQAIRVISSKNDTTKRRWLRWYLQSRG